MRLNSTVFGRRLAAGAGYAAALGALLVGPAQAQGPVATGLTPARNAAAAPRTTAVAVTFNQALANNAATLGALKVFSAQAGGKKAGTATVSGNTLRFQPTTAFKAGETVLATATAGVQSSNGAPARPQVFQFTTATTPTTGIFGGGPESTTGNAEGIAVGDLDGDGDLDLVGGSQESNVGVFLNNGSGTFAAGQQLALERGAVVLALGDLDSDGDLDLVSISLYASVRGVSVRLNDGRGVFSSSAQNIVVGNNPVAVALGDVDGDGDLDLAVASTGSSSTFQSTQFIGIQLNNGGGAFSQGPIVPVQADPKDVALGDVDNDGDLDLVSVGQFPYAYSSTMSTRLNDGQGNFGGGFEKDLPNGANRILLGNLDGDSDLDAVVTEPSYQGLTVQLNNGSGDFATTDQSSMTASSAYPANGFALGDIDGNGVLDLVGASFSGVNVRRGYGSGFYPLGRDLSDGQSVDAGAVSSVALGDVDGDGDLDILALTFGKVKVRLNQAPTTPPLLVTSLVPARNAVAAPRNTAVSIAFDQSIANTASSRGALRVFSAQAGGRKAGVVNTYDNDNQITFIPAKGFKAGETVLVTLTAGAQSSVGAFVKPQVFQFTTATRPTNGLFGGGQQSPVSSDVNGMATGDLNGDGTLDLVTTNARGGTASVRFGDGRGGFAGGQELPLGAGPQSVVLADVNGDGALDIVAVNAGIGSAAVSIRYNDGRGGFRGDNGQNLVVRSSPTGVALGDLDGDGDLDLVASYFDNGKGGIEVRFNNGAGTFGGGTSINLPVGVFSLALGDFDGDGDLDLVNADPTGLSVRLNNGAGAFGTGQEVPTVAGPSKVLIGDVDGDGDLDLLAVEYPYAVGVRLNDGKGSFSVGQEIQVAVSYGDALALGDVDGDGDLDLVTGNNNGSPKAAVLLNNGAGTFAPGPAADTGNGGNTSLVLGDVDNDGDLDILAGGLSNGIVSVRLNQPPPVLIPPTLASASPATGIAGSNEVITLTGTNFTAAAKVMFNGTAATGVVVVSATELRVTVPAGATSGPVVVTTADGPSNGLAFTVRPAGFPLLGIASVAPTPNANGAPTATAVAVTFAQAPARGSGIEQALQVFSQQAGGRKAGTSRLSGSTLTFQPAAAFKAGETVLATAVGSPSRVFQFTTATAPTSGIFGGGSEVPTGTTLNDLVTGDVDGDGDLDIITANGGNGDLSIRLNKGDGTYTNGQNSISSGGVLTRLALGDVDGDGDIDILVTSYLRKSVSTSQVLEYFNDGRGNFTFQGNVSLGSGVDRLVLGDVDGDGDLDLLAPSISVDGNFLRLEVNVRLNDGRGKFSGNQNLALGASELALGDADGDGDLDLFTSQSDGLSLSLNNGQGIFGASRPLNLGATTGRILLGDLNGDGRLDVASGATSIGLGNGTGNFASAPAAGLAATALGDVDGDGDLDLVGPSATGSTVSVRLNNGQGGFGGSQEVAVTGAASVVVLGDVDSDGDLDILAGSAARPFDNSTVSVRLNQKQAPVPATFRLNAGGGALTTSRGAFAADQYFDAANSAAFTSPAAIAGTPDPALYQTERFSTHGVLSYALPVANGKYNVVLHFAEIYWTKPGQRVFDINLEGAKVKSLYDIVQKVGPLTATTETFAVTVTDGVLNLDLTVPYLSGGMDQAKLSALEVLPASTDYRVNAGAGALATSRGAFAADQSFSAASATATTAAAIAGTPDPALYQTERYSTNGVLSYALPVANGKYNVVLHFAEIYWTKPGQRVFDAALEGTKVLDHYDIVQKVGPLTATTETFAVTVTDGVLNLDLSVPYLSGGMDQAKLSALEVLSASGSAAVAQAAARPGAAKKTNFAGSLSAYPNPAPEGNFTLAYTAAQAQTATLVLSDALGRIVQQRAVTLAEGPNQVPVQAPGLPVGIYQLTLRLANGQHPSQRVAIVH
ncbi:FG-GAP-like repeat-containing protein [Hymenobacter coccineus]|uniref:IPT/TIG domain-containing protein n=1 Tax=Hymenobacter coccineus TaxID=1908235 RepID=A0A1G1SQ80_9BACT|nr:FG-GAP-like repeat-containing protein [Hymenobacter coccineus]OGX80781.1 hypothetical protein BEN49_03470 [Hymenobacter coccineus]